MQCELYRNNVYQSVESLFLVPILFLLAIPKCLLIFKGPLMCKIFIAEKGSVLLVEKLCGTLSCKQWLHSGEIRGLSCQNLSFCN